MGFGLARPNTGMVSAGLVRLLLLVMLALPFGSVAAGAAQATILHADARLLALAASEPEATLPVIVQKSVANNGLENAVSALSGSVTQDLHIINAFAAQIPASALATLAANPGVRFMSLDAPVGSAGGPSTFTTWASDFSAAANTGSNASLDGAALKAGTAVWFSAVASVSNMNSKAATLLFDKGAISFTAGGHSFKLSVPAATISLSPDAKATSQFNAADRSWATSAPSGSKGDIFLTGLVWNVPFDLPDGVGQVQWSGRLVSDTPGMSVNWKWSAATYSNLNSDYNKLGVGATGKTVGAPANGKLSAGKDSGVSATSAARAASPAAVFGNIRAITRSPHGPNGTYGVAGNGATTFTSFAAEKTPGNAISKVEVALRTYTAAPLSGSLALTVSCGSAAGTTVNVPASAFNTAVGAKNARTIYADVSSSRKWQWSDFDGCLSLKVDGSKVNKGATVYYDAIGLRVSSTAGNDPTGGRAVATTSSKSGNAPAKDSSGLSSSAYFDPATLGNPMARVVRASDLWNEGPSYLRGSGTTIAVVDSGVFGSDDLSGRIVASINTNPDYHEAVDMYGHGTFVANIAAGDGSASGGAYAGIAPQANVVNVRVSDDEGGATEHDVVAGLQWINDNRSTYNIKVVNMSLNSAVMLSPSESPMDAAAEILWFNGVTVVVAAGNNGTADIFPPANDPFVITVGASDDNGTISPADDSVATFSAWGTTAQGINKPDIVAPGRNMVSYLPDNENLTASREHPANRVNANYFRMSGTSMAAPVVAGAVALLLQDEPNLTPDQVKYRLTNTANTSWAGYNSLHAGSGLLDVYAAVHGTTTASANTGQPISQLLTSGDGSANWGSVNWNSVNWNSVNWNSVNWNSVNWNSVNWNSVNWNSDYWGGN